MGVWVFTGRGAPRITQLPRDGTGGDAAWDIFIEDLSANGTYLNGRRQTKNTPTMMRSGDEISLCNRFTSQEKPTIAWFIGVRVFARARAGAGPLPPTPACATALTTRWGERGGGRAAPVRVARARWTDWVFLGEVRTPALVTDMDRAKAAAASFDALLAVTDEQLRAAGVASAENRQKIVTALSAWEDEHNMPGTQPGEGLRREGGAARVVAVSAGILQSAAPTPAGILAPDGSAD